MCERAIRLTQQHRTWEQRQIYPRACMCPHTYKHSTDMPSQWWPDTHTASNSVLPAGYWQYDLSNASALSCVSISPPLLCHLLFSFKAIPSNFSVWLPQGGWFKHTCHSRWSAFYVVTREAFFFFWSLIKTKKKKRKVSLEIRSNERKTGTSSKKQN